MIYVPYAIIVLLLISLGVVSIVLVLTKGALRNKKVLLKEVNVRERLLLERIAKVHNTLCDRLPPKFKEILSPVLQSITGNTDTEIATRAFIKSLQYVNSPYLTQFLASLKDDKEYLTKSLIANRGELQGGLPKRLLMETGEARQLEVRVLEVTLNDIEKMIKTVEDHIYTEFISPKPTGAVIEEGELFNPYSRGLLEHNALYADKLPKAKEADSE